MNKIKIIVASCLVMIFSCVFFTSCSRTCNDKSNSTGLIYKGFEINFNDEFYIDCKDSSILASDTNQIRVKKNTKIKPKIKSDFKKKLINSNTDKIDFENMKVYHGVVVNNQQMSFDDFENYETNVIEKLNISFDCSDLKPIGIGLYQKVSQNKNWTSIKNDPTKINNLLEINNDAVLSDDPFLIYLLTFNNSTASNSESFVENIILNNNSFAIKFHMEIFLETTYVLPTIICKDTKDKIHFIHLDTVAISIENNYQEITNLNILSTGLFNKFSSIEIIAHHNISSIKK